MKKYLFFLALLFSLSVFGQGEIDGIKKALQKADAEMLSKHFDAVVDVKLPEQDELDNLGKEEASSVLSQFFKKTAINGFESTSQRQMGSTMYITGKLYADGKNYNITMMLKTKDGKSSIITVRIN